jgi:hypothetical protein
MLISRKQAMMSSNLTSKRMNRFSLNLVQNAWPMLRHGSFFLCMHAEGALTSYGMCTMLLEQFEYGYAGVTVAPAMATTVRTAKTARRSDLG